MIEQVETKFSVRDGGHYMPAMKYNGVVYVSGQLSIDPLTGKVPPGGVKEDYLQYLRDTEQTHYYGEDRDQF